MPAVTRALLAVAVAAAPAAADSTSGIDAALTRSSYDANGGFAVEGARLLPKRDLSLKASLGYGRAPLRVPVPGIGDAGSDRILDEIIALDLAFGMTLTDRVAIGIDIAAYRTSTGVGYGDRGRYRGEGTDARSTGLVALRPLSNIDPSASPSDEAAYLGVGLAGPLDTRLGVKLGLVQGERLAIAAIGSVVLPFGEDTMLLGDRGLVFEPALAVELRVTPAVRLLGNAAARLRKRTILEGYDARDPMQTAADARVFLDVGSELVVGGALLADVTDAFAVGVEAQLFAPLPEGASYGSCARYSYARCETIGASDYFEGAERGDRAAVATAGAKLRLSADVTATLALGGSLVGMRGETVRVATGIVWAPQPIGATAPGRNDRDGDRVADPIDGCPDEREDEDGFQDDDGCVDPDNDGDGQADADDRCPNDPEDRDAFEDADGCPERDNDSDAIPDAVDRCAEQAEDVDGFEDEDGCPDPDNDGDGFADAADQCVNDAETLNGVDDQDGCPDVRATAGPEERADRIDLKGQAVGFTRGTATLTTQGKQVLAQVAAIVKARRLAIRVEVHVPLGTRATRPAQITAQKRRDRTLSRQRARAIADYLLAQGVPVQQVQAVGLGADRPLGTSAPTDPSNERVDVIKAQQGGAP